MAGGQVRAVGRRVMRSTVVSVVLSLAHSMIVVKLSDGHGD